MTAGQVGVKSHLRWDNTERLSLYGKGYARNGRSQNVYFNSEHHPYTGTLNSEMPGDSIKAFLYREDVLVKKGSA